MRLLAKVTKAYHLRWNLHVYHLVTDPVHSGVQICRFHFSPQRKAPQIKNGGFERTGVRTIPYIQYPTRHIYLYVQGVAQTNFVETLPIAPYCLLNHVQTPYSGISDLLCSVLKTISAHIAFYFQTYNFLFIQTFSFTII